MKVLIPGISSPVGRILAAQLVAEGHEVVGLDRRVWRDPPPGVEFHAVDIRKRAAAEVFRRARPECVVHMATVTHLVAATEERYRINLGGTRAVFEHSAACGVKHVIFVGRHTYYGAGADQALYHPEDDPPMAVTTFPELSDLVAADLYASQGLWRHPEFTTTVLRISYLLGPTGTGTLAGFLRGSAVPTVIGFDPLFQYLHERDAAAAIATALRVRPRGVFNVAGPSPMPLSAIIREAGRVRIPIPEAGFQLLRGRFGLPRLPRGAVTHIKYPVVVDSALFRKTTGWTHEVDELRCIAEFRAAFPPSR